ncbi:hypothetical protein LCGC14_1769150, partial [marine sediment metagenome]
MATPFDEVLFELKRARGLDLSGYRRSMLQRRLKARLARLRCDDLDAYLQRLRDDPSECDRLIDAIAINVSAFFRDPVVWEIMAQSVLPEIVQRKAAQGSNEIRAWSAGCAAGSSSIIRSSAGPSHSHATPTCFRALRNPSLSMR